MKFAVYLFLLIVSTMLSGVDFSSSQVQEDRRQEGIRTYLKCEKIAKIYEKVEGHSFLEITEELDDARLKESGRRVFLFQYPSDGLQIKGYVSFVDSPEEKPLLVFLRGGNEYFGVMHPVTSYSLLSDYTVVATCYRGGVSEGADEFGGADVKDVYNLIKHIPTLEKQLNTTIGHKERYIMGGSRGGFEMFLALNRYPELQQYFDAAIALSSPLDLRTHIEKRPDMLKMFQDKFAFSNDEWLNSRDPMSNIDQINKEFPLLIIQGTEDDRVYIGEGKEMVKALKERGCSVDYIEVVGGEHCLKNMVETRSLLLVEWLNQFSKSS